MRKTLLCLFLFFISVNCINAECYDIDRYTFSVDAKCYDKNGFVENCHVQFTIKNGLHYIRVTDCSRYGLLSCFSKKDKGIISRSDSRYGSRWWYTGAYYVNGKIDRYNMVIFDPTPSGARRIFYKYCPADKSSMSESNCAYEISEEDWNIVFKRFIIQSSKTWEGGLEAAKVGDPFGDGIHLNQEALK